MKWFKHEATANMDAKLQEVLLDYGLEGYGLYWYCLELIAGNVDADNLTFELEHDARIIARNTGSSTQKVEEMMSRFSSLGLFENSEGVITCLKLSKVSDDYTSKIVRVKYAQALDSKRVRQTPTNSEKVPLDKNKLDKNKSDNIIENTSVSAVPEKKVRISKSDTWKRFYEEYPENRRGGSDATAWKKAKQKRLTEYDFVDMLDDVMKRKAGCSQWHKGFVQGITKYIDEEIWKTPIRFEQLGDSSFATADASLNRLLDTDWADNL